MPHPVDIHVGKRIRQFRLMRGMTQREVAERAGVRMQQLQKYENATNRVSASRMWDIAHVLGVPVAALFEGQAPGGAPEWADGQQARLLQLYNRIPGFKRAVLAELVEALAKPGRARPRGPKAPRTVRAAQAEDRVPDMDPVG